MKVKEKAKELVGKFRNKIISFLSDTMKDENAKQCALIAVDEIISACEYNHVESYNTDWWNEVKQEINNL